MTREEARKVMLLVLQRIDSMAVLLQEQVEKSRPELTEIQSDAAQAVLDQELDRLLDEGAETEDELCRMSAIALLMAVGTEEDGGDAWIRDKDPPPEPETVEVKRANERS